MRKATNLPQGRLPQPLSLSLRALQLQSRYGGAHLWVISLFLHQR